MENILVFLLISLAAGYSLKKLYNIITKKNIECACTCSSCDLKKTCCESSLENNKYLK